MRRQGGSIKGQLGIFLAALLLPGGSLLLLWVLSRKFLGQPVGSRP
jgi:hypothetical protein